MDGDFIQISCLHFFLKEETKNGQGMHWFELV